MTSDAAFGCGLAALFVLVAFVTTGGTDLGPNTWMEIAAALLAAAAAAAVIVIGGSGPGVGRGHAAAVRRTGGADVCLDRLVGAA